MGVIASRRKAMVRLAVLLLLLPLVLAGPAYAERSEAERAARWADLRHAIFGDRQVTEAEDVLALERLGKMKLTLADRTTPGAPVAAKLLVSHPNYSGLQMDQLSRNYIPADFMQTLEVSYNGSSVFRLESDISISEDPGFNFSFRPAGAGSPGVLTAEILDSNQRRYTQSWPVPAAPQM